MDSLLEHAAGVEPLAVLSRFRRGFHACLTARADELSELAPGRTSWAAVLDAIRLGPGDDETEVTAAQLREVVARLIEAGHWREGDLPVLVVFDAGYDVTRLAWLLADLPVELLGRLRSDRVMWLPVPPRQAGTNGRPRKHGGELALSDPATWPEPQVATGTMTS